MTSSLEAPPLSRWRYLLYAIGAAMIGYGVWGQLYGEDTKPARVAVLVVAAALVHDLVLAPAVLVVAVLMRRLLPRWVHPRLQATAFIAFCLFLIAIPGLGRYGTREDNPSVLPRDYTQGLLLALAVLVVGALLLAVVSKVRRRR